MARLALVLLLLALVLNAVGFISNRWAFFEVLRVVGAALLAAGVGLLLVNHARTADPSEK
jgi:hypothetical protein